MDLRLMALVMCMLTLTTVTAVAQPASKTAQAEQLFRDGKALMAAGQLVEACKAFEGSQRIEPNANTLMNLANCRERSGELATAWALYLQTASALRSDADLAATTDEARRRAAALEPRLSRMTIEVPDDSRLVLLTITLNGEPVDAATWGRAMPVDGGRHIIAVTARAHRTWSTEVTLAREGDRQTINVPRLEPVDDAVARPMEERPRPAELGGRRKVSLGVSVVALGALGTAVGFELSGRASYDEYDLAPEGPDREALYRSANNKHRLAQGMGIVALAATGTAAYLWFTGAPSRRYDVAFAPSVAPGLAGIIAVRGF